MEKGLELRMYGWIPYNISEIQKGIQFGHALQELNNKLMDGIHMSDQELISDFNKWRKDWKTFIILNGGTMNERISSEHYGGMNKVRDFLKEMEIEHACFYEPDLNDGLSGIVTLVDERCFNEDKYPLFRKWLEIELGERFIRDSLKKTGESVETTFGKEFKQWTGIIGGPKQVALKYFLKQFRLA